MQLMNGGSLSIESPRPYSPVASGLLLQLGIDVAALSKSIEDEKVYAALGLRDAVFFDAATFGADRLLVRDEDAPMAEFLRRAPLDERIRSDIARIEESTADLLAGLTSDAKKQRLSRLSYRDFLLHLHGATPDVLPYYQKMTHSLYCVGIEAVSALDCWAIGLPGFQGLALAPGPAPRMGYTAANLAAHGWGQVVHFPDGNATVARALLRGLVPAAVPGSTIEDLVTTRVDYGRLDDPRSAVRVRLNSTVIQARNSPATGRSGGVGVTYVRDGMAFRAHARHCVLACWNAVIPYLCPDLPARQKEALRSPQKTPLVYASVGVRNWQPFVKLGVASVFAPGSYFSSIELNESVRIGRYATVTDPAQATVLRLTRMPCSPGQTEREQNRAGRAELLATPFETFERQVRDQLARTLDGAGFDPARDITAITVNRWPHGYAHEYNPLYDDELPESEQPHVLGRARNGAIAIANSDAAGAAYADAAIDQAQRAVTELLQV
jgi:spermidine dehydrogenase